MALDRLWPTTCTTLSAPLRTRCADAGRARRASRSTCAPATAAGTSSPGSEDAAASLAFAVDGPGPAGRAPRARSSTPRGRSVRTSSPFRPRRTAAPSPRRFAVAASAAAVGFGIWAASLHHSLSGWRVPRSACSAIRRPVTSRSCESRGELVVAPSGEAVLTVSLPYRRRARRTRRGSRARRCNRRVSSPAARSRFRGMLRTVRA